MRPATDEYPVFFQQYLDLVPEGDVIGQLEQNATTLTDLLKDTSETASLRGYAPGKWSPRQVVAHLTDLERVFAYRAYWFARDLPGEIVGIDEEQAMETADADARTLQDHLAEFASARAATISLFKGLPQAAWTRKGSVSGNTCSVRALAHLIVGHQLHHMKILKERYDLAG